MTQMKILWSYEKYSSADTDKEVEKNLFKEIDKCFSNSEINLIKEDLSIKSFSSWINSVSIMILLKF